MSKLNKNRGPWISTYPCKKRLHLLDPKIKDIDIQDIAWSLSMLCRYNGYTREFYSVAQHSTLVSHYVPEKYALCGLLHDAAEAYIGDNTTVLKEVLPDLTKLENTIYSVIAEKWFLPDPIPEEVKNIDLRILKNEEAVTGHDTTHWSIKQDPIPGLQLRLALDPTQARLYFLRRYLELVRNGPFIK